MARLHRNGSLDTSFSGDGRTIIDFGSHTDIGWSVAVDANGRILVGGYSYQGATNYDFAVAALEGGPALLTPQQLIDQLTAGINQLVLDGRLTEGQGTSLKTKLKDVVERIDAENWNAAAGTLDASVHQVEAWDGTLLTHEEAVWLINLIELVLAQQP